MVVLSCLGKCVEEPLVEVIWIGLGVVLVLMVFC